MNSRKLVLTGSDCLQKLIKPSHEAITFNPQRVFSKSNIIKPLEDKIKILIVTRDRSHAGFWVCESMYFQVSLSPVESLQAPKAALHIYRTVMAAVFRTLIILSSFFLSLLLAYNPFVAFKLSFQSLVYSHSHNLSLAFNRWFLFDGLLLAFNRWFTHIRSI